MCIRDSITTLLDISVDQFFFPCNEDGENNRRKQVDVLSVSYTHLAGSAASAQARANCSEANNILARPCGIVNTLFAHFSVKTR